MKDTKSKDCHIECPCNWCQGYHEGVADAREEIEGIIGEDEDLPFTIRTGVVGQNHPQKDECQLCWAKEGELHKADCRISAMQMRNNFRHSLLSKIRGIK